MLKKYTAEKEKKEVRKHQLVLRKTIESFAHRLFIIEDWLNNKAFAQVYGAKAEFIMLLLIKKNLIKSRKKSSASCNFNLRRMLVLITNGRITYKS